MQDDLILLLQLAELESLARQAQSLRELGHHLANDAHGLLVYRQALVVVNEAQRWRLLNISGLVSVDENTPYRVWLDLTLPWLRQQLTGNELTWLELATAKDTPEEISQGLREWWPAGVCALPLTSRSGELLGWVLFLLDQAPNTTQSVLLKRLALSWSYCWEMLTPKAGFWQRLRQRKYFWRFALAALLLLLIPMRQSALAPTEITSLDLQLISAPMEGVIKTFHIRPNETVKQDQPLFSLDDTTLLHQKAVAEQAVAVADAELLAARQGAFNSNDSKAQLPTLQSRAQQRRAELDTLRAQLQRMTVLAPRDGVAVFTDPNEWLGKPVVTGERVLQLANPEQPAMLIQLPVADAIELSVGTPVVLYLTVRPLSPLTGRILETSYQSTLTAEGIPSYRLRASVDKDEQALARIGLKGTAKIKAGWSILGYEMLRRPLAALRELTGL
jgi:multidrug resistance efflux pump